MYLALLRRLPDCSTAKMYDILNIRMQESPAHQDSLSRTLLLRSDPPESRGIQSLSRVPDLQNTGHFFRARARCYGPSASRQMALYLRDESRSPGPIS